MTTPDPRTVAAVAAFLGSLLDADTSSPVAATHGAADTSPTAATVHPGAAALTRVGLAPQAPTASPLEVA